MLTHTTHKQFVFDMLMENSAISTADIQRMALESGYPIASPSSVVRELKRCGVPISTVNSPNIRKGTHSEWYLYPAWKWEYLHGGVEIKI